MEGGKKKTCVYVWVPEFGVETSLLDSSSGLVPERVRDEERRTTRKRACEKATFTVSRSGLPDQDQEGLVGREVLLFLLLPFTTVVREGSWGIISLHLMAYKSKGPRHKMLVPRKTACSSRMRRERKKKFKEKRN